MNELRNIKIIQKIYNNTIDNVIYVLYIYFSTKTGGNKMSIICVTGHRPNKLWGYDLRDKRYQKLKSDLMKILIDQNCTEAISGMALGVDTVFALAVLKLKDLGFDIKLHCAIPCKNHSSKWIKESIDQYNRILNQADNVVTVTDDTYQPWMMQKRNEYMVDLADKVIAVWDGSSGGTSNCIKYAKKKNIEIIRLNPKDY